jgi:hypothetical protein
MIAPEPDPLWVIAFWLVVGISLTVTIYAAIVVAIDFVQSADDADVDPPAPVRVARPRVDPAAHQTSPLAAVPRLRPRDARVADPLTFDKRRVN